MIPEKGACLLMGKSENIKIDLSLVGHVLLLDSRRTWLIEPSISHLFLSSRLSGQSVLFHFRELTSTSFHKGNQIFFVLSGQIKFLDIFA